MSHFTCPKCHRDYSYDLRECTWCGIPLEELAPDRGTVVGVTEVQVPSLGHEDVPYWCALVRADDGSSTIVKLDHPVSVSDAVSLGQASVAVLAVVGILGTGVMGCSLVELLLSRGHRVVWRGRSEESMEHGARKVTERLSRFMSEEQVAEALGRLETATGYESLSGCDVVIEVVTEETSVKQAVLSAAEHSMRDDAILATNTSGLSVDELSSVLARPERFTVMHFFNPATRMRLVETAGCAQTSPDTRTFVEEFARVLGKIPVQVAATPGFAVNRALMPLLNEAVRELEEGVASAEAIDEAVRLGLNHPMGPLALVDLIGLDVVVHIMENLAERTGDATYAPRPLLRALVSAHELGRKTGKGFYEYPT